MTENKSKSNYSVIRVPTALLEKLKRLAADIHKQHQKKPTEIEEGEFADGLDLNKANSAGTFPAWVTIATAVEAYDTKIARRKKAAVRAAAKKKSESDC